MDIEQSRYRVISNSNPEKFEELLNERADQGYFLSSVITWQTTHEVWGIMIRFDDEEDDEDDNMSYQIKLTPN